MEKKSLPKTTPEKNKQKNFPYKKEPYRPMFGEKQEKTLLYDLIHYLHKNDLLPTVLFVFSRAKCDRNAEMLTNIDLTTEKEKSRIHMFFEQCIRTLKEPDRDIPQIMRMREILKRGVGVHHSGILPILKEMVEMLFQDGLLKVRN